MASINILTDKHSPVVLVVYFLSDLNFSGINYMQVDRHYVPGLMCVQQMEGDEKTFSSLDLPFTTTSAAGHDVSLSTRHTRITMANRHEYVRLALNYR